MSKGPLIPPPPPIIPPPPVQVIPPPPPVQVIPPPTIIPPPPPIEGELMPKKTLPLVAGRLTRQHMHPYQVRTVQHMMDSDSAMLWLGLGLGKRLTLSTPILTINGWKTHGTIEAGDVLVHPKGGTNVVTQAHAVSREEVYELELMDGRVAECHHEHLWTVDVESVVGSRTDGTRRNRVVSKTFTTAELMSRSYKRYALQRIERIDLPEKDLPIEPYLLGALIADGSYSNSHPTGAMLSYHADDQFVPDKCNGLLPDGCMYGSDRYTSENGKQVYIIGIRPLLDVVGLGGKYSGERFIPEDYLNSSYEQRLALLRGLMDCDGSIRSRNRKQYSTTSRQLADDIHQLVMTLGGTTSVCTNTRPDKPDSASIEYNISITFVDVNPFSLPRKADKVKPSTRDRVSSKIKDIRKTGRYADMRCISTERPDGLYVINDYMVTHNTVSTLTGIVDRMSRGEVRGTLVVAPLRVCQLTWKQEAEKWDHTKHLKFNMLTGTPKQRQQNLFSKADVYLINFEGLGWLALQLKEYFVNQGQDLPFDMIVWDEISKMKRPESNRFKEFKDLIRYFRYKVGLTASPASNGLHNTWGQFFVLDSGQRLGLEYSFFKQKYFHKTGGEYGKFVPYESTREMIVDSVSDMTIEIAAEGNIELPEFNQIDVMVRLTPKLMKAYVLLERDFEIELDSGTQLEVFNAASLASKLLQFSSGVMYNVPDPINRPEYRVEEFIHKLKDAALDDIMEDSGDEPILLAYNFSSERNRIMAKYPDARCLTGVEEAEAIEIMEKFNNGEIKLLLCHPLSAGFGLNLQQACCTIVWYGIPYNLESYEQLIGRIQRQGNKSKRVTCHRILCEDTMDIAVSDALRSKDAVQEDLKVAMRSYLKSKKSKK